MNDRFVYRFALLFLIITGGCKKFVEVPAPVYQLMTNNVFKSNEKANGALTTIYAQMIYGNTSPFHIALYTGLAGDELANPPDEFTLEIYSNAVNAKHNIYSGTVWETVYNYIYQANMVYEYCDKATALNPALRKQLMAEALFIRAYWHFYLLNMYGDIPVVISTEYNINKQLSRTPVADVYKQIVRDLTAAQRDLSVNYVGADGIAVSKERLRPDQAVAAALLARVYLYMGKYNEAEEQASLVIGLNGTYKLVAPEMVFKKDSEEAIWQLMVPKENFSDINTPEGKGFILTDHTGLSKQAIISTQLYNSFEKGDLRKDVWIGVYEDKTVSPFKTYCFPFKYKIKGGSELLEYSMIFRLAEQYLIRAECRAQAGKLKEAISDIDMIRQRAGLPWLANTDPDISKIALLNAVLKERQVELFTEQAHRWFDLKRTQTVDAIMNMVTASKGSVWKTDMQIWPLPTSELWNNSNLKQNPGYN